MALPRLRRRWVLVISAAALQAARAWLTPGRLSQWPLRCQGDTELLTGLEAELRAEQVDADKALQWCRDQGPATWAELLENSDALVEVASESLRLRLAKRAGAEGQLQPALALLQSPALRPAALVLLELLRAEGQQKFEGFIDRAVQQMEEGQLDWPAMTAAAPRLAPHGQRAEQALRLLTLGNNLAEEVIVNEGSSSLSFKGLWAGQQLSGRLRRSHGDQGWGQWASFFLEDAPDALLGSRLVACKRASGETIFNQKTGEPSFQAGDTLFFATADRAALLEMATYDQLPEFGVELARLLRDGEDEKGIMAPPEMLQAAKFVNEIRDLNEAEQAEQRLRRFEQSPLARRLHEKLLQDEVWEQLWQAAKPKLPALYQAVRKAMLRARPAQKVEPRRVSVVRISLLGVIGVLVVLGALGWGAWQFFHSSDEADKLPLYTLKSTEVPDNAPLFAGTQLMPFKGK